MGIGGGPIYIFALTIFIGNFYSDLLSGDQQVKMVIANSSFAKMFATFAGVVAHFRNQNFLLKEIVTIAIPAVLVVVICSNWLSQIEFSKKSFSLVFILMILPMLGKMVLDGRRPQSAPIDKPTQNKTLGLILLGVVAGVVPAVSGLGGGFIVVPVLIYFLGYTINESISVSLGVIFCTSVALTLYYWLAYNLPEGVPNAIGAISYGIGLPLVVGVLVAAPLGVKVSTALKPRTIKLLFVAICLIIIGKTIIVDLL